MKIRCHYLKNEKMVSNLKNKNEKKKNKTIDN